jgi:hypothetical protein
MKRPCAITGSSRGSIRFLRSGRRDWLEFLGIEEDAMPSRETLERLFYLE